jgi:hypothetical protein
MYIYIFIFVHIGLFSSCEAVKYGIPSSTALINNVTECRNDETKCPPVCDKIFVMTQYDDTQIGQNNDYYIMDCMSGVSFLRLSCCINTLNCCVH